MVKASKSGLFLPHNSLPSQNLNGMSALLEPVQPGYFPTCVAPVTCTMPANRTMPRIGVPSVPNLKTRQNGTQGFPQSLCEGLPESLFPPFQNLLLAKKPYLKENISALSRACAGAVVPNAISGCQRKFVIFDQSRNETRLIYSSFPTATEQTAAFTKVTDRCLNHKEHADNMDHMNLTVAELQEVGDENFLSSEESEMHEDTEEINALLCSDDDYDVDSEDDDDEVTSTGHSPFPIKNYRGIQGHMGELSEEVSNSDGQNKRRKLLDGGHTMSSQADISSLKRIAGVHTCDDETEPSRPIGENQEADTSSALDNKQLKKDTVGRTLKILESIIPGAKDKDPLLVLDIAIDYLKSLKHRAKSSGMNYS